MPSSLPALRASPRAVPDSWRRPLSAVMLVLMAAGLVGNAVIASPGDAPEPIDYSVFGGPGADILTGQWVGVFREANIQAGPLELVFWGVPHLLGVHGVVGWIVFDVIVGALFSVALVGVTTRLVRPLTARWAVPLGLAVATLAALSAITTRSISVGHPAEFVIPLMWMVAGLSARHGRDIAAAALVAASAGWELWGLLGIPVLLLAPRIRLRTVWRSALGGLVLLAILFLPFVLLGPFHMFSWKWPIEDHSLAHLLLPHERTFPWQLRVVQGVLSVGAGAVVAVITRRDREAIWLVLLAICAVRLFTDPVLYDYYTVPSFMLILIGAAIAVARRSIPVFVCCLVMVNVLNDLAVSVLSVGILLVVVIATTVLLIRQGPRNGVDSAF